MQNYSINQDHQHPHSYYPIKPIYFPCNVFIYFVHMYLFTMPHDFAQAIYSYSTSKVLQGYIKLDDSLFQGKLTVMKCPNDNLSNRKIKEGRKHRNCPLGCKEALRTAHQGARKHQELPTRVQGNIKNCPLMCKETLKIALQGARKH